MKKTCKLNNLRSERGFEMIVDIDHNLLNNIRIWCKNESEKMEYYLAQEYIECINRDQWPEDLVIHAVYYRDGIKYDISEKADLERELPDINDIVLGIDCNGFISNEIDRLLREKDTIYSYETSSGMHDNYTEIELQGVRDLKIVTNVSDRKGKKPENNKWKLVVVVGVLVLTASVIWWKTLPLRKLNKESESSYENAEKMIEKEEYFAAIEVLDDIDAEWKNYEKVYETRVEAIIGAMEYHEEKGEYKEAILHMQGYMEEEPDDNDIQKEYDKLLDRYKDKVFQEISGYFAHEEYGVAMGKLENATALIGEDEDINAWILKCYKAEIKKEIGEPKEIEQYENAILLLRESEYSDEELDIILENYEKNYRKLIMKRAEKECDKNGYQSAVKLLKNAKKILKNDVVLSEEIEKYEKLAPVNLGDLEVFGYGYEGEYNVSTDQYTVDRYNNTYTRSFSIETEETISWLLNGKYEKFSGVISCPKQYQLESYYSDVVVRIYCDGKKVYTSKPSGPEKKPQKFSIDVSGVEMMKIEWDCLEAWNIWSNWSMYATIFDGVLYPSYEY